MGTLTGHNRRWQIVVALGAIAMQWGCAPTKALYLDHGADLAQLATSVEYPDVRAAAAVDTFAQPPLSSSNPPKEFWELPLEEAIFIALQHSEVIRSLGTVRLGGISNVFNTALDPLPGSRFLQSQVGSADFLGTAFNVAIAATDVSSPQTQGVQGALAEFDTQVSTSLFWERTNRPQNTTQQAAFLDPFILKEDRATFLAELSKRGVHGGQFAARNNTLYLQNNRQSRNLPSEWQTQFEFEARQPLLRGAGVAVNTAPILIAATRTDIEVSRFECDVRDLLFDVVRAYWNHYYAYRFYACQKEARDSAYETWKKVEALQAERGKLDEAEARRQYYEFSARLEAAEFDLYKTENRLRYLLGITPTDGRLIRPCTEPTKAKINFDWYKVLHEGLTRSCELCQKRLQIHQRELQIVTARNQLLPQLDVVGQYRFFGAGDDLITGGGPSPPFPAEGSDAFGELFDGDFQEWTLGVEMNFPVGFRRERAGVQNAHLRLAREQAVLAAMEQELSHLLTDDIQNIDGLHGVMGLNEDRLSAAEDAVTNAKVLVELDDRELRVTLDRLLDAQRQRADARCGYYRSLVNYTLAIMQLHFDKGSLLDYSNVVFAGRPGPAPVMAPHPVDAPGYFDYRRPPTQLPADEPATPDAQPEPLPVPEVAQSSANFPTASKTDPPSISPSSASGVQPSGQSEAAERPAALPYSQPASWKPFRATDFQASTPADNDSSEGAASGPTPQVEWSPVRKTSSPSTAR